MLIHKFNLKDYVYKTHKAFVFYEALMKINSIKKTKLFDDLHIPATSYRYAKRKEQNVGKEILFKLEKYFQINPLSFDKVQEYENTLSNLYQDIYYRNTENIFNYAKLIDQYIDDNNILGPVFKCFKILINFSDSKLSPKNIRTETRELFQEARRYIEFFNEEIKELFKIVEILSSDYLVDANEVLDTSNNLPYFKGMIYFVLATNSIILRDYKNVVIYGRMCEEELVKDYNYRRLWSITLNIIAALNALGNFRLAYDMVIRKISCMNSFNLQNAIFDATINHYYVSCLGINEIEEILNIIDSKEKKTTFEYLIIMLINYNDCQTKKVDEYYKILIEDVEEESIYRKIGKSVYQIFNNIDVIENYKYLEENFNQGYVKLLRKNVRIRK